MFEDKREVYGEVRACEKDRNFWRLPKCDPVKSRGAPSHNLEVERAARRFNTFIIWAH